MIKLISKCTFLIVLVYSISLSAAPIETFKFDSPETEKIFHKLSEELRCLVCQNQNIAESNADLAKDLRLQIYNMLQNGKSEEQIISYMVDRYGDYVLYRPPFKPLTWLLWLGPTFIFFIGLIFVVRFMKEQSASRKTPSLSEEDRERIKSLHAEKQHTEQDKQ